MLLVGTDGERFAFLPKDLRKQILVSPSKSPGTLTSHSTLLPQSAITNPQSKIIRAIRAKDTVEGKFLPPETCYNPLQLLTTTYN
jgi:hypothetical protein